MTVFTSVNEPKVAELLNAGLIGVIRTDTLYGVLAKARDETAVKRVYELKDRDQAKSPIVLIRDKMQLFDSIESSISQLLDSVWPGPVSVILPSVNAPLWIRRDNNSVAYRMPDNQDLLQLLEQTGPLIAPSANPEGEIPAINIDEAKQYFGDKVDFYVDGGQVSETSPSQLLLVDNDGKVNRLR